MTPRQESEAPEGQSGSTVSWRDSKVHVLTITPHSPLATSTTSQQQVAPGCTILSPAPRLLKDKTKVSFWSYPFLSCHKSPTGMVWSSEGVWQIELDKQPTHKPSNKVQKRLTRESTTKSFRSHWESVWLMGPKGKYSSKISINFHWVLSWEQNTIKCGSRVAFLPPSSSFISQLASEIHRIHQGF